MKPLAAAGLVALLAIPAHAGDASGFDPAAIDQCLEGAVTQGARADCADAGMEACLTYTRGKYTGDDPDFPMANCLDASHQAWEAQLTTLYEAALAASGTPEGLREMERSWIAFRKALCASAGVGKEGGDLAHARCLRNETARQAALLMELGPQE